MQERLKKESNDKTERRVFYANERNNKFKEKQLRVVQIRKENEGKRREMERKWKVVDQKLGAWKNAVQENGREEKMI